MWLSEDSVFFFFSSRRRHTRWPRDWSSDVCSSDLDMECRRCGAGPCLLHEVLIMVAIRYLVIAVLLVAWFPSEGAAATAFVQSASISEFSSGTTDAVTFTRNVKA